MALFLLQFLANSAKREESNFVNRLTRNRMRMFWSCLIKLEVILTRIKSHNITTPPHLYSNSQTPNEAVIKLIRQPPRDEISRVSVSSWTWASSLESNVKLAWSSIPGPYFLTSFNQIKYLKPNNYQTHLLNGLCTSNLIDGFAQFIK